MHRCYLWTFARTTHLLPSLVREPRMLHEYFFWCEVLFVAPTKHLASSIYFITALQHKRRAMRGGERLCTLCRDNFGRNMSVLLSSGVRARDCTEDMPAKKRKHTDRHGSRSPIAPVGLPISPIVDLHRLSSRPWSLSFATIHPRAVCLWVPSSRVEDHDCKNSLVSTPAVNQPNGRRDPSVSSSSLLLVAPYTTHLSSPLNIQGIQAPTPYAHTRTHKYQSGGNDTPTDIVHGVVLNQPRI